MSEVETVSIAVLLQNRQNSHTNSSPLPIGMKFCMNGVCFHATFPVDWYVLPGCSLTNNQWCVSNGRGKTAKMPWICTPFADQSKSGMPEWTHSVLFQAKFLLHSYIMLPLWGKNQLKCCDFDWFLNFVASTCIVFANQPNMASESRPTMYSYIRDRGTYTAGTANAAPVFELGRQISYFCRPSFCDRTPCRHSQNI